ncbi:hypothetical protein GCM10010383_16510 [Streptomyces lomondensis]|uniref:Uncharacterized protein n=1 Tax=Streptomyces lomondensis TaxID=68229 RepID=A0ABQ2WZY0_9ACTN|nr:hypothetical protein GCM10010383_16510 [Streptomyces lomondensis]
MGARGCADMRLRRVGANNHDEPAAPENTKPHGENAQFNIARAAKASPRTRSAAASSTTSTTSA